MIKNKFFAISSMILLITTENCAQIFNYGEHVVSDNITVSTGSGHQLNAGFHEGQITKVTNTGTIAVNNGLGINLYSASNRKGRNYLINDGTVEVNKGKGMQTGSNGIIENNRCVTVKNGADGVIVNGKNSQFVNNNDGTIVSTRENSKGITVSIGEAINNGKIQVSNKGIGVYLQAEEGNLLMMLTE